MYLKKIFTVILAILLAPGCKNKPGNSGKPGEGTITYSVTYPEAEKNGIKTTFLPKEIILVFKDEKAVFIATGGMGMAQVVNLLDHRAKKSFSLLLNNFGKNYGCAVSKEEINANENNPHLTFDFTNETKTIAGIECKKTVVTDNSNNSMFDIYYDDGIKFSYWNSPFKDMNNLLLEYTHTINNLTMKLMATKVDLSTPVDTSLFEVKGNFNWVSQKDFFIHLSELQNL
jgi:hypothetical protein